MAEEEQYLPPLEFSSKPMFSEVMRDPDVFCRVIHRLIGNEVGPVTYVETEREVHAKRKRRSIRVDAFLKAENGVRYDVEMQVEREADLPLRFRGYQSVLDASHWKTGTRFSAIGHSYVIFLCMYDPFGKGRPVYRIERCITGDEPEVVDTQAHWLAFDASAWAKAEDPKLRNLLRYAYDGTLPEGDGLLERIDEEVARLNRDRKWRSEVMTLEEDARVRGVEEGVEMAEDKNRRLYKTLKKLDRLDDYDRAMDDPDYKSQLVSELRLES